MKYTYNPDGSIQDFTQSNGMKTLYGYDIDKNLTHLNITLGEEVVVNNTYTYDHNGNRLQKDQQGDVTSYTYDSQNRLAKVDYPTYGEELHYDKVGNRTKRIAHGIQELYQYDPRNRLTTLTSIGPDTEKTTAYTYDNQGNLLQDDKQTYQYDAFNRTTQVDTFDGNVQINRYDAENLRHEIVENGNLASFIFSHSEVVVETNTTDTIRLIRGYDIICSDSEKAKTYYHYASDELGSTTHIFEGDQLRNTYAYDAFGNITSQEETIHNRFKYTGQQHDPITQQYYLRARFTQEDVYRGDGLNLYAYCRNNPVRYYDPSGYALCDKSLHDRLIAKGWDEDRATQVAIDYAAARNAGISAADAYKQATGKNPLKVDERAYQGEDNSSDNRGWLSNQLGLQESDSRGLFYSVENANGGSVYVSIDPISSRDFEDIVLFRSGRVNIISGIHGDSRGGVYPEIDFYNEDIRDFASQDVQVYDYMQMNFDEISRLINSSDTTICAWCWSERNPAVRMGLVRGY